MEARRSDEARADVGLRHFIELAQHIWGLSWSWIEVRWTDEYLWMMVGAYRDRRVWEREWEMGKLKFLAAAFGAEVKDGSTAESSGLRQGRAAETIKALDGVVEYVH